MSIVESQSLGLLIGRDILEALGGKVDTTRRELQIGAGRSPLHDSDAGHYAVDVRPGVWKTLNNTRKFRSADDDLPKPLQHKSRLSPPKPQQVKPQRPNRTPGSEQTLVKCKKFRRKSKNSVHVLNGFVPSTGTASGKDKEPTIMLTFG